MGRHPSTFWTLEEGIDFLNHGSFGATPRPVQEAQLAWRERLEAEPVRFFQRELESALDAARHALARFVGASDDDLAFVPNATTAVNSVLRSYPLQVGDELLVTDHIYNACRNVVDLVAARAGARVVVADIPFPIGAAGEAYEAVLSKVGERTRLAVVEHVTSPTALVLPVEDIVGALSDAGIDTLVDGAHAPGMVPLDLGELGATFYTGNCHKWMCAPKGAGFLHVSDTHPHQVLPAVVSHGYNTEHEDRSRFHLLFDWTGTDDPTAFLSVPAAIEAMGSLQPGGWPALMAANRELARSARDAVCAALDEAAPAPDEMLGSMASIPLPNAVEPPLPYDRDPLQDRLLFDHEIEVPIQLWPSWPRRVLRLSAQAYNRFDQYERLAAALAEELAAESHR